MRDDRALYSVVGVVNNITFKLYFTNGNTKKVIHKDRDYLMTRFLHRAVLMCELMKEYMRVINE